MRKKRGTEDHIKPIPTVDMEKRIATSLELFHKDFPLIFTYMIYTGQPYNSVISFTKNELLSLPVNTGKTNEEPLINLPDNIVTQIKKYPGKSNEALFKDVPAIHPFRYALEKVSPQFNADPCFSTVTLYKTFVYHLYLNKINIRKLANYCKPSSYEQLSSYLHLGEEYLGEQILPVTHIEEATKHSLSERLTNVATLVAGDMFNPFGKFATDLDKCLKKYGY